MALALNTHTEGCMESKQLNLDFFYSIESNPVFVCAHPCLQCKDQAQAADVWLKPTIIWQNLCQFFHLHFIFAELWHSNLHT